MSEQVSVGEIIQKLYASGEPSSYSHRYDLAERIKAHGIAPPEGYVLVPVEPTAEMISAYSLASEQLKKNHLLSGSYPATWQPIKAGYKAMLSAVKEKDNE